MSSVFQLPLQFHPPFIKLVPLKQYDEKTSVNIHTVNIHYFLR